jgi:hypothetical protein
VTKKETEEAMVREQIQNEIALLSEDDPESISFTNLKITSVIVPE